MRCAALATGGELRAGVGAAERHGAHIPLLSRVVGPGLGSRPGQALRGMTLSGSNRALPLLPCHPGLERRRIAPGERAGTKGRTFFPSRSDLSELALGPRSAPYAPPGMTVVVHMKRRGKRSCLAGAPEGLGQVGIRGANAPHLFIFARRLRARERGVSRPSGT